MNIVIWPVSLLRIAMGAAGRGARRRSSDDGHLTAKLGEMQHRADLYDLIDYEGYNHFDTSIFNFTVTDASSAQRIDATQGAHMAEQSTAGSPSPRHRPDQEGPGRRRRSTTPPSRRSTPRRTRCCTAATPCRSSPRLQPFEEVAYLLWHGELPDDAELAVFEARERSHRGLDHDVKRVIDELPLDGPPDGRRAHRGLA